MLSDAAGRASPREGGAIARVWHGVTLAAVADDYLAFLRVRAIGDYRATPGNLAAFVMHRREGRLAHFLTVSHWASWQAIEAFAGEDVERARYYPEDAGFLLAFEPTVRHYLVEPAG
ncbi:MAG TPA: hypothetical protein VM619_11555 [Luteimonas sp.]|nr:hypothetical protein [Luteimonas sp.]